MVTRAELVDAVGVRYRGATQAERSRMFDEFAAVTGYHRKHAIRLLAKGASGRRDPLPAIPRQPRRLVGEPTASKSGTR